MQFSDEGLRVHVSAPLAWKRHCTTLRSCEKIKAVFVNWTFSLGLAEKQLSFWSRFPSKSHPKEERRFEKWEWVDVDCQNCMVNQYSPEFFNDTERLYQLTIQPCFYQPKITSKLQTQMGYPLFGIPDMCKIPKERHCITIDSIVLESRTTKRTNVTCDGILSLL